MAKYKWQSINSYLKNTENKASSLGTYSSSGKEVRLYSRDYSANLFNGFL